jgi:hypothetical protein
VLITSRNPNWAEIAAPVNVAGFAAEESVTLLQRRVPGISAADARHIAAELDNFPLALSSGLRCPERERAFLPSPTLSI